MDRSHAPGPCSMPATRVLLILLFVCGRAVHTLAQAESEGDVSGARRLGATSDNMDNGLVHNAVQPTNPLT